MSTLQIDGVTDEIAEKVGVTGDNVLQKTRVTRKLHKLAKSRGSRLLSTLQIDGVTNEIARKVRVTGDDVLQKTRVTRQLHKRTSKKNFATDATRSRVQPDTR